MSESLITPPAVLTILRRKVTHEPSGMTTCCPSCEGKLYILETSFVCENTACRFSRGSPEDLLALELGSYEAAVDLLTETNAHLVEQRDTELRRLKLSRKLLEFAFEAERLNHEPDIERVRLQQDFTSTCRASGQAFNRGHWMLTSDQSTRLAKLLFRLGVKVPDNLSGKPAAVAPFWGNQHQISALYICAGNMLSFRECQVVPYRCSWFGLAQMHPSNTAVDVFPEYVDAMANEERFRANNVFRFPTQAHVDPKVRRYEQHFESVRFHGAEEVWYTCLPDWSHMEEFEDATFMDMRFGSKDLCGLMEYLMKECLSTGFSRFIHLCSAMKMGNRLRSRMLVLAHLLPHPRYAERLKKALSRRLLDRDSSGAAIYETAQGYEIQNNEKVTLVTNFTLDFRSATHFSDSLEQDYEGYLCYLGQTFAFNLPGKKFESPALLQPALQNIHSDGTEGTQAGPNIFPAGGGYKKVMDVLRIRFASLPRNRGYTTLGWGRQYDTFITPVALVTPQGIKGGIRYRADSAGMHTCYTSGRPVPESLGEMPELDPYLAEMLSAMLGQVIRSFNALPVQMFPIQSNPENHNRALRIFHGLGQNTAMRMTLEGVNARNLGLNRGMPCLVVGLNKLQGEKLSMPGVWLAERGLDLAKFSLEQIEAAGRIFPRLVLEAASMMVREQGFNYKQRRSVRKLSAMAEEGADIIRREIWPDWPRAGQSWAAVDSILEPGEKVFKKNVAVDETRSIVVLKSAVWEGKTFTKEDLAIELGLLCDSVVIVGDTIEVDRNSLYCLLEEFYGEVPRLQPA